MEQKPNIILITVDALRADHLGFMGYRKDTSPCIDRLVKECVVFSRAFSAGPNTPHAFPALLTSTYLLDYQGPGKIEKPRTLISEVFQKAGYVTAAFHSNPYLSDFFGYNRGWDFFEYVFSPFGPGLLPSKDFTAKFILSLKDNLKRFFKNTLAGFYPEFLFKLMYSRYKSKTSKEEFEIKAPHFNKLIKDFVGTVRNQKQPFFLWVHYMDVHSPYLPKENHYREGTLSYSEFISAWLPGYLEYARKKTFRKFIEPYLKQSIEFYDQSINFLDEQIADLLDFLKEENIYQNTILCLTADHGEEFLEHGEGFHNAKLYNELLHVPLLIKIPGRSGETINRKTSLIGLAPTLCALAGIVPPPSFKGKNFFDEHSELVFHQTAFGTRGRGNAWVEIEKIEECKTACQSENWKYILNHGTGEEELYDLAQDPGEQKNIALSRPEIVSSLRKKIEEFEKENPPLNLAGIQQV